MEALVLSDRRSGRLICSSPERKNLQLIFLQKGLKYSETGCGTI